MSSKVESVEVFTNDSGTRVVLHIRKRRVLSDVSIPLDDVPPRVLKVLRQWLEDVDE